MERSRPSIGTSGPGNAPILPIASGAPPDAARIRSLIADPCSRRIAPFLHACYKHAPDALPADLTETLRRLSRETVFSNMVRTRDLDRLLAGLQEHRIDVIPLKGTTLAERVYGGTEVRPSLDIDLLVRADDLREAVRIVRGAGHEVVEEAGPYHVVLLPARGRKQPDSAVELHWSLGYLAGRSQALDEQVWDRATVHDDRHPPHLVMDPSDELLYLCTHLFQHRGDDAYLALDVHLGAERLAIDWPALVDRARALNLRGQLAIGLALARHWFGTTVPDVVTEALGLPAWKRRHFERVTLRDPLSSRFGRRQVAVLLDLMIIDETWRDRLSHLEWAVRTVPRSITQRHTVARLGRLE